MKIFALGLLVVTSFVCAQTPPRLPPASFAEVIGIMITICPIETETTYLKYRAKTLSPEQVATALKKCPVASLAQATDAYASRVSSNDRIPAECLAALKSLRVEALTHWENYNEGNESPGAHFFRISSESTRIKQQSTRARLACE